MRLLIVIGADHHRAGQPEDPKRRIGLTVINARQVLNRDGRLIVTVPETVEASADDLALRFKPPEHYAGALLSALSWTDVIRGRCSSVSERRALTGVK